MGIICIFIGLPVTVVLLAVGILIILFGQFLYKRKSNILSLLFLFLTYIPMSIICALYFSGIYEAMKYFLMHEGIHNILDPAILILSSMLVGTLNVIEPGSVLMGGNGPKIDTTQTTTYSLVVMLIVSLFLVFRFCKKNK